MMMMACKAPMRLMAFLMITRLPAQRVAAFQGRHVIHRSRQIRSYSSENCDADFMELAIDYAKRGFGRTYPNPAVGCVLVNQNTNEVIGSGFHPRAGLPHAEVFALLEACGHVPSGVDAAMSIVKENDADMIDTVLDLTDKYMSENGPEELFGGSFFTVPVTAYVTLEPCCHYGQTPPCASSLVLSQVNRVVVGFRDPNPRVDGGGVRLLEEAGITVDFSSGKTAQDCAKLVECFVKRITTPENDYSDITGAMRSALRSLAGRKKTENALSVHTWPSSRPSVAGDAKDLLDAVDELPLEAVWLETADALLWKDEIVLLRLGNAVAKKKGVKRLGERIALELDAHVAQTVGHTVLLYRPGAPPIIDLSQLLEDQNSSEPAKED